MSFIGKGLVVYCDGGTFRDNPGPYGCGLHWYLYSNKPYEKFPINGLFPTTLGYWEGKNPEEEKIISFPQVENKQEFINTLFEKTDNGHKLKKKPYLVFVEKMKEYSQGYDGIGSNNLAELQAYIKALRTILEEKPDFSLIYCDSQYILSGRNYLSKWIKEDWLLSGGRPVANQEEWKIVSQLQDELRENKLNYAVQWIKGHGDSKGDSRTLSNIANVFADKMATIAASLSNNFKYQLDFTDTKGIWDKEITKEDLVEEKKGLKPHPLLINKRMYLGYGGRTDKSLFFLGDPGDINTGKKDDKDSEKDDEGRYQKKKVPIDIFTGKMVSDNQLSIVYLEEGDKIIEKIEDIQNRWLKQHYQHNNLLYCLQMDNITNTKTYTALNRYGSLYLRRPKGVPNLETIEGKGITYVNDPLYLAMRNIDKIQELNNILQSYIHQDQNIFSYDLTHLFYKSKEQCIKKTLQGQENIALPLGKTLLSEIDSQTKSIKLDKDLHPPLGKSIILTLGVDLPRRNQLKGIETEYPNVQLLIWHRSGVVWEYAILLTLYTPDEDKVRLKNYAIYRGVYSSQILVG